MGSTKASKRTIQPAMHCGWCTSLVATLCWRCTLLVSMSQPPQVFVAVQPTQHLMRLTLPTAWVRVHAAWYRRELRLQTLDDGKYWLTDEQPVVVLGDSSAPNATVLCFYQATSSTIAPHGGVVLRALQNPQQGAALLSAPHSVWSAVPKDGLGVVGVATDPDGRPVVAAAASS